MIDLILSFIPGEWIAAAGLAVVGLAAIWLGGRKAGKADAKVDALKSEVKAHELRNEVENRVATERDAADRLRTDWTR